jgi:hypothetical protein
MQQRRLLTCLSVQVGQVNDVSPCLLRTLVGVSRDKHDGLRVNESKEAGKGCPS